MPIQKQLNCNPSNANLAKNINNLEPCKCNDDKDNQTIFDRECLKKCLKEYTDTIAIIEINNDKEASLLEMILIYLKNPKYNIID